MLFLQRRIDELTVIPGDILNVAFSNQNKQTKNQNRYRSHQHDY